MWFLLGRLYSCVAVVEQRQIASFPKSRAASSLTRLGQRSAGCLYSKRGFEVGQGTGSLAGKEGFLIVPGGEE